MIIDVLQGFVKMGEGEKIPHSNDLASFPLLFGSLKYNTHFPV